MAQQGSAAVEEKTETRDGMRVLWDAPIAMNDGIVLRADVFRPLGDGRYPVILTYGPYGKGLAFQEGNKGAWEILTRLHPEILEGSSSKYQVFELVDPEKWVPEGYALVRVDSRGTGRSPGYIDYWSPRETQDLYDCIEWSAAQPWCNGKVGLNGISYFAMNAWQVACLEPPHLAAICAWEGAGDFYRDTTRHGGIMSMFLSTWAPRAVKRVQYGMGERGPRSAVTGELVCGPPTLPEEELARNSIDIDAWIIAHPFDGPAYRARSPDWEKVKVPLLSAANWGGMGLHPRGNFDGFVHSASQQKWLEAHGGAHWESFYTNYGEKLQKKFFGHFLKGELTGWESQPPVQLQIRHPGEKFVERHENEWPLARTQWSKFYLHPGDSSLRTEAPTATAKLDYEALGDGLLFLTPPLEKELEVTGPVAAKLFVSSTTCDADLFLVLRVFAPDGQEVTFRGSNDPRTPIGLGWLRASHRKLDPHRSRPYQPYHTHDEAWPLTPGESVELDIEILPTCIVIPVGYCIGLAVRGKDYEHPGPRLSIPGVPYTLTGVGPFLHTHPKDRPPDIFGGTNSVHFDSDRKPYLLLPVIPPK